MGRRCLPFTEALEEELKKRGHRSHIHYKGYRNHPLTTHQKYVNRLRSRIRVRVEHGFGSMVNEMKRTRMRCIGQQRAATWIRLVQPVLQHAPVRIPADRYGFRWLSAVAALCPNIRNRVKIVGQQPISLPKTRSE